MRENASSWEWERRKIWDGKRKGRSKPSVELYASWNFWVYQRLYICGWEWDAESRIQWALAVIWVRQVLLKAPLACDIGIGSNAAQILRDVGPQVMPGLRWCCCHHHYDYRYRWVLARSVSFSNPDTLNFFPTENKSVAVSYKGEWMSTLGLLVISLSWNITDQK